MYTAVHPPIGKLVKGLNFDPNVSPSTFSTTVLGGPVPSRAKRAKNFSLFCLVFRSALRNAVSALRFLARFARATKKNPVLVLLGTSAALQILLWRPQLKLLSV